ncbi:hypothetical protein ACFVIM_20690 [Streptomyces sp. NPDC057638]|uniref:hypothetical protein n=1 Tax=Streptomyces sp. NPDC057638 TaxID=3346190 RepID=UPI0036CEDE1D
MNDSEQPPQPVVVTITGCSKEDADTVFRVLGRSYASDRAVDDMPEYMARDHPTVWTATFDITDSRIVTGPAVLAAPVTAEAQGGYWAVDRMRATLAAAFEVHDEGTAAGDQEKDVQLRLESGHHGRPAPAGTSE